MKEEIINTLKDLLSFKTYKDNKTEFTKLYKYIKEKYNNLYIKEYDFDGRKAMILSNNNEKDQDVIFCTHIDVVYADDYSITEDQENIYGRGTIDMKCSVATCLTILNNINTKLKIALFITSDEEIDGATASKLSKIYNSKIVIVPDGGSNFDLIKEEKGLIQLELSITTKTAHAAQLFDGENAILKLIKLYQKIIKKYPLPKSSSDYITSVNLSKLEGGTSNNQVPGNAKMVLDIRNIEKDKQEDIIEFIKNIDKKIKVKILTTGPTFNTDLNNKYIKQYINSCKKILKKDITIKGCESTSDAIFFKEKGIPTVIMNPIGYNPHSPNEYVNKDSLLTLYNIYEDFIKEFENE